MIYNVRTVNDLATKMLDHCIFTVKFHSLPVLYSKYIFTV